MHSAGTTVGMLAFLSFLPSSYSPFPVSSSEPVGWDARSGTVLFFFSFSIYIPPLVLSFSLMICYDISMAAGVMVMVVSLEKDACLFI